MTTIELTNPTFYTELENQGTTNIERQTSNSNNDNEIQQQSLSRRASSIFSFDRTELPGPDENDLLAYTLDDRHFNLIRNLHLADYITLLNGFCGFLSIISCLRSLKIDNVSYVQRSFFFILLGGIFDFLDGRVARLRKKASLLGQELDSLSDLISFGVAPAITAFTIGLDTTIDVLCLSFFTLAGLARLARFNITINNIPHDHNGKARFFEGLPIPTSLVTVTVMAILIHVNKINENILFGICRNNKWGEFHYFSLIFVLHGCAFISKSLKVPKF